MAQKKITDLTLRSSVTDDVNVPIDDTIETYRVTMPQIFEYLRYKFQNYRTIDAAGTDLNSSDVVVFLDPSVLGFTQMLPACGDLSIGFVVTLKNIATNGNTVLLDGDGSEKIDNATTLELGSSPSMDSVTLFNTGSKWLVI